VANKGSPHAFVVAKSRSLRHLDHAADFTALQQ
jgi:hypothetical protein